MFSISQIQMKKNSVFVNSTAEIWALFLSLVELTKVWLETIRMDRM